MAKFQNVKFNSIDEFLAYLPVNERAIVENLRGIITTTMLDCKEKLAYNVPFYYRNLRTLFIWPFSVPWGKVKKQGGVVLGFCKGYLMNDDLNWLEKGNRKQVYSKTFYKLSDIETNIIKAYINEAIDVDNRLKK